MHLARKLRTFRRDRKGATAVEFALIAGPFFFFLMALIEVAAVFFASTVIENAVLESAREIRTGQVQAGGMDADGFRDAVCERIEVIADCARLEFDVRVFADFDNVAVTDPVTDDGDLQTDDFGYDPGDAGDIVMVRVFYRWPVITDFMRSSMSNLKDNKTLHFATATWQNEPFDD